MTREEYTAEWHRLQVEKEKWNRIADRHMTLTCVGIFGVLSVQMFAAVYRLYIGW